jgi:NADH:ubiquinone oxidoreductase subunit E
MTIDDKVYGRVKTEDLDGILESYKSREAVPL